MSNRRILPPMYFFVSIIVMIGLHFSLPLIHIIAQPYNFIGILFIVVGVVFNIWCDAIFKKVKTTVKPFEKPDYLVVTGPYRLSRHPMYLGMAVVLIGLAILLGSLTPMFIVPVFAVMMDRVFIQAEEKAMEETFGNAYREYRKKVRRWI